MPVRENSAERAEKPSGRGMDADGEIWYNQFDKFEFVGLVNSDFMNFKRCTGYKLAHLFH